MAPDSGDRNDCEPPNINAKNQTGCLWKQEVFSNALTVLQLHIYGIPKNTHTNTRPKKKKRFL